VRERRELFDNPRSTAKEDWLPAKARAVLEASGRCRFGAAP